MSSEFLPAVVIPTYNNVTTIAKVINAALSYNIPVIAVNDGSNDGTLEVIESIDNPLLILISHLQNRGKGEALKSAFAKCLELGYTTAITIDAGTPFPDTSPTQKYSFSLRMRKSYRSPPTSLAGASSA